MPGRNPNHMMAGTPHPDLPCGLLESLLEGKVLRPDRIAEARRWVVTGVHPDARAVAEAVVREAITVLV